MNSRSWDAIKAFALSIIRSFLSYQQNRLPEQYLLCLTSKRTNLGRDADPLVSDNEATGLIQRDAKNLCLA